MSIDAFNSTIDHWIHALDQYDFETMLRKPSPAEWSIGQVYMHLIENADFCIEQIKLCLNNHDHADLDPAPHGKFMLEQNDFPDEIIEGPPSNQMTPQPESKDHIRERLLVIRKEVNDLAGIIQINTYTGKAKHPGLFYMNATEWLQFTEMHLRHHFRQKARINHYLAHNYTPT
jgi:hypothetical protein